MGHQCDANMEAGPWRKRRASHGSLKQTAFAVGISAATVVGLHEPAAAASNINTGSTYLASNLGNSVNADFAGGTLQLDSSTTIGRDFKVENVATNTIDIDGSTVTMSGAFTGAGPLTIIDSKGGGNLTLTGTGNTYTGSTTIDSGALLSLSDTGTIATSSSLIDNGTFDISAQTAGASIISLSGTGAVNLGGESLGLSDAADTFSGVISGSGGLVIAAGSETLTGVNTYTGYTTITTGTLTLTGNGSIAASSGLTDNGVFDMSATPGASLVSLSGTGRVVLGSQNLTLTSASGAFYGVISGSGSVILNGGTELLSGANTFTGPAIINAGTLEVDSTSVAYNVSNNGTFAFDSSGTTVMNGVISGSGAVSQIGIGIAQITTPQTYTGATTITLGRLTLTGSGSIASSSSVTDNGTLDISAMAATSITSLSGSGAVYLGSGTLTLTDAAGSFSGTMSGLGNVVLASGTETLTGSNTYTGTTTISSGTLIMRPGSSLSQSRVIDNATLDTSTDPTVGIVGSASIASLGGNGTVSLGANTLVLANASDTFSGTISGAGGLTINGGTETLSGANTYTGTTTISSGSLVLSATGSLAPASTVTDNGVFDISATSGTSIAFGSLSGTGTVALGAHSLNLTSTSGVFSGTIQGTGGLTVSGGTEILAGANSYTGGTAIASGATLQIGNGTAGGSFVGGVADSGTLAFKRSDSSVFSGLISGSGAVVQSGTGTTILTADSTYTGGTTITNGTLQLGNGGNGGSILGNVTDNGTLAFGRSDTATFTALIAGTGGVRQVSGTTILTAAETYTGATLIDSGAALMLGNGSSIATSSGVIDNGTFDVSAATAPQIASLSGSGNVTLGSQSLTLTAASGTFSGTVSGTGGVTLDSGSETFSGTNGYTGLTTVNGGSLTVNGSIASSQGVMVNSGGKLAGTGTVSAITVASGGTLAPGSAGAGTLTATGPVTFASGSNYVVSVSSASASNLTTSGAASLAGTLSVTSPDGTYLLGQKLTVLTANGGVTGGFTLAPPTNTGAVFSSALTYDAKNVYLEIDLAKLTPLLPSGATANQKNAVGAIDAAIAAGDTLPQSFENLGNVSSATLAADATQLGGEIGGDVPLAGSALFTPFMDAIFDHISDGRFDDPISSGMSQQQGNVWVSAFDGTGSIGGDPESLGSQRFRSNATGLIGGANFNLSPNFMLGGAVSVGTTNFHLIGDVGTGKATALQGGIYGFVRFSPHFYGSFAGAFAQDRITTHRIVTVSGTDDLMGKVTGQVYGGRYETGVTMAWLTPYVAFQDTLTSLPAYSETAASGANTFALSYASRSKNASRLELGIRQSTDVEVTPRWLLTPDGTLHLTDRLAWAHDFSGDSTASASFVALPSSSFTIYHAKNSTDSALVSLGADLEFEDGLRLNAHLDSAISPNAQSYTGMAGLGYTW